MSARRTKGDKEDAATHGPKGFAELCESMMSAAPREGCGGRMREMMSRCMANFPDREERNDGEEEGGGDES